MINTQYIHQKDSWYGPSSDAVGYIFKNQLEGLTAIPLMSKYFFHLVVHFKNYFGPNTYWSTHITPSIRDDDDYY